MRILVTFRDQAKTKHYIPQIVDVDGLYLYRKQQSLMQSSGIKVAPMDPPDPPLSGWKEVTDSNVKIIAPKVPLVTSVAAHILAC